MNLWEVFEKYEDDLLDAIILSLFPMSIQYYILNEPSIVGEYYVFVCVYVTCVTPVHTIVYIVIIVPTHYNNINVLM